MTQPFSIIYRDEVELAKIASSNYDPHKHDYEELIIVAEGTVEHFIDFKKKLYNAPLASFVTKGKLHKIVPKLVNGQGKLWVLQFKSEFVPETAFHLYSHYHDNATIALQCGSRLERIISLCEMIQSETLQTVPEFSIIKHLLSALLTMVESEWKKDDTIEDVPHNNMSTTFKSFLQVLEENFCKSDGVDFYAEKLSMTTRNLNLICQNIWQKSVSEIIEDRKLIEAKNLLINTDKTVAEIGFELGYEQTYFASVFKKKSGQTPGEFRREMKKMIS